MIPLEANLHFEVQPQPKEYEWPKKNEMAEETASGPHSKKTRNFSRPIILAILLIFAFAFTFACGKRGFMPLDQSLIFDGAYRIYWGQVPYKDFVTPYGPLVFILQAIVFRLFGVSYSSYILLAATCNALAVFCTYTVLTRLDRRATLCTFAGTCVTAVWFYPPIGTFYAEQTSFLFGLLAFLCVVPRKSNIGSKYQIHNAFVAGVCLGLAFFCKQNCGALLVPLVLAVVVVVHNTSFQLMFKSIASVLLGITCVIIFAIGLLYLFADLELFWKFFFEIPREQGTLRLSKSLIHETILFGAEEVPWTGTYGPVRVGIVLSLLGIGVAFFTKSRILNRRLLLTSVLIIGIYFFHNLVTVTMKNNSPLGWPFLGLAFGSTGILAWNLIRRTLLVLRLDESTQRLPTRSAVQAPLVFGYTLMFVFLTAAGAYFSWSRQHDEFKDSAFQQRCQSPILNEVSWSDPVVQSATPITAKDIDDLYLYLHEHDKPFFILGDCTILYAMLGQQPPQPVVWFHEGLTFVAGDDDLDQWIAKSLKQKEVKLIVVESLSLIHSPDELLDKLPALKRFKDQGFTKTKEFGGFSVFESAKIAL